ncbi:2-dehydro-3-deoxy-6-phosphogalactonate aldolase [Agaribacterium haliotis]|uniref:2-dehydro-3-deoxy-6-phosphogalactonate aldolase n=1 Tax=Agaribacterium haliotis TaxID=2013869 RepID=UPI000BB551F1|nr:2-dehydro-3-deoxy-6-phosphogalactonate aldolase [Agaribacterium haliotis]
MADFDIKQQLPLIAILRAVTPNDVVRCASILIDEGFTMIEVPLNSPEALRSIRLLVEHFGQSRLVGAGTVTTLAQAEAVIATGARLVVTPNLNEGVIRAATAAGCVCLPGVVTPSEAFTALAAGASGLKLFPISQVGLDGFKALRSVLPAGTLCIPVGGINPSVDSMKPYLQLGADGFGLGASLYRPDLDDQQLRINARAFVKSYFQALEACK